MGGGDTAWTVECFRRPSTGPIAEAHGLTMLQFACAWALSKTSVKSVVPTLIQERGSHRKSIESQLLELAALPEEVRFKSAEQRRIQTIGDNRRCPVFSQNYKGGSPAYHGPTLQDRWAMTPELEAVAGRWEISLEAEQFLQYDGQNKQRALVTAR